MGQSLQYLNGLGSHFETESYKGALVKGCNSPQKTPLGLFTEQISGTAFTMPRHLNLHAWLYRIRPSVLHHEFYLAPSSTYLSPPFHSAFTPPTQMRWDPFPYPTEDCHFINSIFTLAGQGSFAEHQGAAIHLYSATQSMREEFFYNADGEMLIVPQEGSMQFHTEMGILEVSPGEIIVIPRGIKFQVKLLEKKARGYICENFGLPMRLPELGTIGANGLAHPRDFQIPVAAFEEREGKFILIAKFQGGLWQASMQHSPLDVVAWHGNYAPYKYDLSLFNTINTVSFDHPDPSIFTVLTSPSVISGTANVDFVIFPPRWMVAEATFRAPYYHRNVMSEYMGLVYGHYDAKQNGFLPGGGSLHNCMTGHGPDAQSYYQTLTRPSIPEYYDNTLAFMFEARQVWRLSQQAYEASFRQRDYLACWQGLRPNFLNGV